MKFLIFGGEGFIGRTLKERLLESQSVAKTFDIAKTADHCGSVNDPSAIRNAIDSVKPDKVVNLAGLVGVPVCSKDTQGAFEANVVGAWNVAYSCSQHQIPLIHISSTSVYGLTAVSKTTVSEDDPCLPQSMYGFTKYMGEYGVRATCAESELSSIILRPSNVYGRNQAEKNVIQIFLESASKRLPITMHGDGRQTKCFTYVADVAEAIAKVALTKWRLQRGDCNYYNVSIGTNWSLLDLVRILEKRFGKLEISFEPSRKGDFSEAAYSIERIKADFQFTPSYDLERGIQEILEAG
jgi:UDP-glucose 4-epimerase